MKVKSLPSKWLDKDGRRLDCGPYMAGSVEARMTLESITAPKAPLASLTRGHKGGIYNGPVFRRNYVEAPIHGVPFMTGGDVLLSDLSRLPLLSRRDATSSKLSYLKMVPGATLISCSGVIGRTGFVRPDMLDVWSSQDVLKIVPDEDLIPPGYLHAYLKSKYGVPLVVGGTYGAVIQHIEPVHVSSLPVPRLGSRVESQAHDAIVQAAKLLAEYQSTISQATARVFEGTEIWNPAAFEWFRDRSDLGFVVSAGGLDVLRAWNHSRRAERIKEQIRSGRWSKLGDVTDFEWLRWRKMFQRIDAEPEFGVEVITQRPLFNLFPEGRWLSRKYLSQHSPKYWVPDRTILIAKQGTLGEGEVYCRCEFVTGERMLARAYSDHCMRVVVRDEAIHPGYLFAFLRSEAAFRLLRSLSEGAKQQDLHWRMVPQLPIPRRDPMEEKIIGDSVLDAYRKRNEAVDLVLAAVRGVEEAIEMCETN